MEDGLEPVRRIVHKLLVGNTKTLEANIDSAHDRLRAEMTKRHEEFAKSLNAMTRWLVGAIIGSIGLAVVILDFLIRFP